MALELRATSGGGGSGGVVHHTGLVSLEDGGVVQDGAGHVAFFLLFVVRWLFVV